MSRFQKKWRKLRHRPDQFLQDIRSPALRVIAYPWVWLIALLSRASSPKSAKVAQAWKHQLEAAGNGPVPDRRPRGTVAHLFRDRFKPLTRGTVSLPWRIRNPNIYIPEMLDFAECVAPFESESMAKNIDVFCTWGVTDNVTHDLARRMATKYRRPLLSLEYGFVSSLDIALRGGPQLSIVISHDVMYYDSTQPSYMETRLNSPSYELSEAQRQRARRCIDQIVAKKVSKYNHAPEVDLLPRLNPNAKQRVLLIDQRFGDQSVSMGLADGRSFELMLERACALENCEVLAKVHPDAIKGGMQSYLGPMLAENRPANVILIDFDINPYSLFEVVDKVFVVTSQAGFEALMAGKEVHCFGVPFYAGWGLTTDAVELPRRSQKRTLEDVFHLAYLECSRYYVPGIGVAELETLVAYIAAMRWYAQRARPAASAPVEIIGPAPEGSIKVRGKSKPSDRGNGLRIVIVIPSGRFGATGRTTQDLSWHLVRLGCSVLVLCEGSCRPEYNGVTWDRIEFEGMRLSTRLRNRIHKFDPNIVFENGVRSRAQRAALEIVLCTNARFVLHSEDDDLQVYERRSSNPDRGAVTLLDTPTPDLEQMVAFLKANDWAHSLRVLGDPAHDRWVEPVLRILCYRLAQLHTAIWHPFAARLKRDFGVEALVLPPAIPLHAYDPKPLTSTERATVLQSVGIDPDAFVLFIAGTVYDYSEEYSVFLNALREVQQRTPRQLVLVLVSGRTQVDVLSEARRVLDPRSAVVDLGAPPDDVYLSMLKASDLNCAPGVPDDFNRYRLPSRLVKAMGLGKPIFTFRVGFGESLEHGHNAFLTETDDPHEWAEVLLSALDEERLRLVGQNARSFAEQHFDAASSAHRLLERFRELTKSSPPLSHMFVPPAVDQSSKHQAT